ncbi:nucleotidyl transferase AbiEii/AbiGii toxin family protein [Haloarcula sp. H-GB5]|jgi:hypothetical protein
MSFNDRSNALISLLADLNESPHQFVLVGGYAVSAFETRFSTDLDVVIAPEDRDAVIEFLKTRDFKKTESQSKEWIYDTEVTQYEKRLTPQQPVGVDLLINGLGCRQTEAQWSFNYLLNHSKKQTISGGTEETTARTVTGDVLIAVKLHSGRETDLRDVLAIAGDVPLTQITPHLHRGDEEKLRDQLEQGVEVLDSDELRHGFRSDFGASTVSEDTVEQLKQYLDEQIERLPK